MDQKNKKGKGLKLTLEQNVRCTWRYALHDNVEFISSTNGTKEPIVGREPDVVLGVGARLTSIGNWDIKVQERD